MDIHEFAEHQNRTLRVTAHRHVDVVVQMALKGELRRAALKEKQGLHVSMCMSCLPVGSPGTDLFFQYVQLDIDK